jgi:hypothetical protein
MERRRATTETEIDVRLSETDKIARETFKCGAHSQCEKECLLARYNLFLNSQSR